MRQIFAPQTARRPLVFSGTAEEAGAQLRNTIVNVIQQELHRPDSALGAEIRRLVLEELLRTGAGAP